MSNNFRIEPFLWIHLTGLALSPLLLMIMWIGLAVSDPWTFYWLELALVGTIGVMPMLWMQWTKPFDFFSLFFLVIKPDSLREDQRKILSLLKTRKNKILHLLAAIGLLGLGWLIYQWSPLASLTAAMLPQWRILGLFIAALAFFLCNLFVQVPVSVLGVFLTSQKQWLNTQPIPCDGVLSNFTVFGIKVNGIFFIPDLPSSSNLKDKNE